MTSLIRLSSPATKESWEIPILFENADLLAINKPPRLLLSPDRLDAKRPSLNQLLHHELTRGPAWVRERGLTYLANVHRLDFETSGVLLLAKSRPILIAMADQFGAQIPVQTYLALAHGNGAQPVFDVDIRIAPHATRPGVFRADPRTGKQCSTRFEVLEQFRECALLRCWPKPGRPHQIRIHLQCRHQPVVGDALYGGRPLLLSHLKPGYRLKPGRTENPLLDRAALHAETLEFRPPGADAPVTLTAPWPHDLIVAVKYLRKLSALGGTPPTPEAAVTSEEA